MSSVFFFFWQVGFFLLKGDRFIHAMHKTTLREV
jgi:hypothetical protein